MPEHNPTPRRGRREPPPRLLTPAEWLLEAAAAEADPLVRTWLLALARGEARPEPEADADA